MLPSGKLNFELKSISVNDRPDELLEKPKSEGTKLMNWLVVHSTVSKIPSLSSSKSTTSGTPSPSVSV